jgi:hypothetical protein
MVKSFSAHDLLVPWQELRQVSPKLLLFSVVIHSLFLGLPISSQPKLQSEKTTQKNKSTKPIAALKTKFVGQSKPIVPTPTPLQSPLRTSTPVVIPSRSVPPDLQAAITPITPTPITITQPPEPPKIVIPSTPIPQAEASNKNSVVEIKVKPVPQPIIKSNITQSNSVIRKINTTNETNRNQQTLSTTSSVETKKTPENISKSPVENLEKQIFNAIFTDLQQELSWTEDIYFAQPSDFSPTKLEFDNFIGTFLDKRIDDLAAIVKTKLESKSFKVSQLSNYSDGLLYEVKKDNFTEYISFVPSADGTGVIIVVWKKSPIDGKS